MTGPANHCQNCGIYSQCGQSFRRWSDQSDCKYAEKGQHRDQCMYHTEVGMCDNLEAQTDAKTTKTR